MTPLDRDSLSKDNYTKNLKIFSHAYISLLIVCRYQPLTLKGLAEKAGIKYTTLTRPNYTSLMRKGLNYLIERELVYQYFNKYHCKHPEAVAESLLFKYIKNDFEQRMALRRQM